MKLILTVEVNGVGVECAFKGGRHYPVRENGTYRTSNKLIQAELESHEHYGSSFKLVKTAEEEGKLPEAEKPAEPKVVVPTEEKPKTVLTNTGDVLVEDVNTGQDAKLYLNHNFDVPFSRLKNTQMIMNEAKVANLIFPNWKP